MVVSSQFETVGTLTAGIGWMKATWTYDFGRALTRFPEA
jgi:hypothetical protein